jgi:hypothetical protein
MSDSADPTATKNSQRPLDDVMLAMDVVDTLRHRTSLVEHELAAEDRDDQLIQRLREMYASQGIDVPDAILAEGVAALREDRFAYQPPPPSFQRSLARIYVSRGNWGPWLLGILGVVVVVLIGYWLLVGAPRQRRLQTMPQLIADQEQAIEELAETAAAKQQAAELAAQGRSALRTGDIDTAQAAFDQLGNLREQLKAERALQGQITDQELLIQDLAVAAAAKTQAEALATQGQSALRTGDTEAAQKAFAELQDLRKKLQLEYELQIVQQGKTGVYRIPDLNEDARNYYIIVQAITKDGTALTLPIKNEEDSQVHQVNRWGLRVDEETFRQIEADKQDDGIIQNNCFGVKRAGQLEPEYRVPTLGGAITSW